MQQSPPQPDGGEHHQHAGGHEPGDGGEIQNRIEQAMGKTLEEQVRERKALQKQLNEGFDKKPQASDPMESQAKSTKEPQPSKESVEDKSIEGYKMEEIKNSEETTDLSSSGVQWFASLFIVLIMGLAIIGARRAK